ncbi:MAG: SAF domain-containing protein [Actinomycetota bacterium]|nr:SAF domain-containing protein [Actinomycetota bacterium]
MSAPDVDYRSPGAPVANGNGVKTSTGESRPLRQVRRRRNLPGSRAVAGGLLVAAAAVGLFAAYAGLHGGPSHSYVVAARPIAAGRRIAATDLAMEPMDLSAGVRARAFNDLSVLVGATAVTKLETGELVQPSAVVAKAGDEPGRELSFPVERGHLSATLEEGERVDLLATFGSGNESFTTTVLQDAQVVSIERAKVGLGDNGTAVVAVSVIDDRDEVALAHAIQQGKLTVVRTTGAPPAQAPPPPYRPEQPGTGSSSDGRSKGSAP